ncbi:outer membrane beta-barrel protein [Daejeonella sp.]|uniref:outer membrane beta-barrel protein n=1 Tax=Daejeonella sp. TaxID=2805397 RepID=UPI0030C35F43
MKISSSKYKIAILSIVIVVLMVSAAIGQTSKGNWLVGGSGNFYFTDLVDDPIIDEHSTTTINLSPVIGYFLKNNFVIGLKPSFSYTGYDGDNLSYNRNYSIGPLIRYYFLPSDKEFNLFVQGDFQYGVEHSGNYIQRSSGSSTSYSFLAGPVVFLNSSVGIEFISGYTSFRNVKFGRKNDKFQAGIGFQIHLKK